MTTAKGYTEMKDSGIQWIGQIPTHWLLKKAKYCVSITNGSDPKSEGSVPVYGSGSESFKTCGEYKEGPAVLIGRKGATLHIPHYIEGRYWNVDTAFDVKPQEGFSLRYYYYLACVFDYNYYISQTTLPGMTQTNYNNMKLPCPSLDEQSAIAAYLDTQCAKIDEIIAQAKASIEDYKQWKASIIYEAVTKGLNPNVEMKDSGIEWIGKVPMRWKIVRLKYLLSTPLQYGANETGLPYDESLPRYIRITDITLDGKLKTSGMQSLSEEKSEGYILDDEDILLARSGATVGKAFYYRESYGKAAFAGYLIRAKINSAKALPKFIYYSTMSAGYEKWKETAVIQATIQNIGASRYNEYSLAIPPIAEQLRIIEFLDDKMEKIDSLMAEKQSLIGDLESYKKSLIYEVVTGKRRV